MKNIKLTIALLILTTTSLLGQEFLGVKVDGKKDDAIAVFKSKGFIPSKIDYILKSGNYNFAALDGTAGGKEVELSIHYTPISKLVWAFVIHLPEKTSWYSLKDDYQDFVSLFTEKYGEPDVKFDFFLSPYEEGDGYEMTAVEVEKCKYSAYWGAKYSVSITRFKQVSLSYENELNAELNEKEKKQINKNAF